MYEKNIYCYDSTRVIIRNRNSTKNAPGPVVEIPIGAKFQKRDGGTATTASHGKKQASFQNGATKISPSSFCSPPYATTEHDEKLDES